MHVEGREVEESRVVHERDCAPNEASGEADPPDDELGLGAEEDEGEAAADEGNKEGEGGEAGGEADVPGSGGGGEETKAEHGDLRKGGRGEFNKKNASTGRGGWEGSTSRREDSQSAWTRCRRPKRRELRAPARSSSKLPSPPFSDRGA
jgi:hypothetical protein